MMLKELLDRIDKKGQKVEWERLKRSLNKLQHVIIKSDKLDFQVRTEASGDTNTALKAVGVSAGPTVSLCGSQASASG